jgi:hypothetical protein
MNGTNVTVVTAPEPWVNAGPEAVSVFLAGGIQRCPWWQVEVIDLLRGIPNLGEVVVYNPRRANFPIDDPSAAQAQIEWEFLMLDRAQVFSMWFPNADSDCPICMYELGRHLALRMRDRQGHLVALGVDPGYRRARDVEVQVALACGGHEEVEIERSLLAHVRSIGLAVLAARHLGQSLRDRAQGRVN